MACPVCDQKPMNCDCTAQERRLYAETQDLEEEIERLRSLVRFQDGVIRSGDVACLTSDEREAIEKAIGRELDAEWYGGPEPGRVVALRSLLERLS
jgi:hypothetical protein